MNKFSEMVTRSLQIAASLTTGESSSALLDMSPYKKAMFQAVANKPLDNTTFVGNITVTVYESTASTWNGAVATAMTSFTGTDSCTSGSEGNKFFEINDYDMSINNSRRYLGLYVSAWTKTDMVAIVERYRKDHEPAE